MTKENEIKVTLDTKDFEKKVNELVSTLKALSVAQTLNAQFKSLGESIKDAEESTEKLSIAQKFFKDRTEALTIAQLGESGATTAATTAKGALAIATSLAATAEEALKAAWKTNPVGVIITGVTLLTSVLGPLAEKMGFFTETTSESSERIKELASQTDELSSSFDSLRKTQEETIIANAAEAQMASQLASEVEKLVGVEGKTITQKDLLKQKIETLNDLMPDLNAAYDEENDRLVTTITNEEGVQEQIELTSDALHDRIKAIQEEAKAEAARAMLIDTYKAIYEAETKRKEVYEQQTAAQKRLAEAEANAAIAREENALSSTAWMGVESKALREAEAELANAQEEYDGLADAVEAADEIIAKGNTDIARYTNDMVASSLDFTEIEQLMLEAGEKIPESVKTGIDNGKYAIPQSVSEMLDLISYDEAVAKAEASGFEVPQSIANGIRSGSLSPAEATAEVEALISYETMITDGGFAGDSTITALTDALYAGEMRPSEVMAEANAYLASKYPEAKNAASKGGTDTGDAYNKSAEAEFTKTPGIFDRESAKATPMLNQAEKAGPMGIATVDGSAAAAEKSTSLASALKKVASSALKAVKDFLGIKSPSTVFRDQVGEMIGEGMSVGIQKSEEEVIDSLDSLVEDANKAAVSALSPLEMPKIEKDSFLSSIDALKKETLLKSIESLGSKLPKIYAEMEASAMLHFGILAGGAAANAAAWEDPYYNKQVILRADITNTLDGRLLSKASAPYMDVELRRLDSRGERSA